MSGRRERAALFLILNVAVTATVVAGVLHFARTDETAKAPDEVARLTAEKTELARENESLRTRVDELQVRLESQAVRISELEAAEASAAAEAEPAAAAPAEPEEAAAEEAPSPQDAFAKGMQELIRRQVARQRQRFIDDIVNPTPESEERARRQVERMGERVARDLGLDSRDSAEVTRILSEVDRSRREKLRRVFTSKSDPEDVTYPEVKEVLDDSFAEEDRMITESLPPEKAEAYQSAAEPIRGFIYMAAQTAFPAEEGAEPGQAPGSGDGSGSK